MSERYPGKESFRTAYKGQPPWEIGRPQPAILDAESFVRGRILDVGCGTGDTAAYWANRGHEVVGIDFLEAPIELARRKYSDVGDRLRFVVADALELSAWDETFDTVIDSGLFHVFSDEDRFRYAEALHHRLRSPTPDVPGGTLVLQCFSEQEPGTAGPRRVTADELRETFGAGWEWLDLQRCIYELRDDLPNLPFTPGGAHAWRAILQKATPF